MADPDTLQAIVQHMNQGQFDEAADLCLPILRQNPRDVPVIALYGKLAIQMGRSEDAIIILRKLLAIAPDHGDAHEDLARAYNLAGDYGNARTHALRAVELDANSIESRLVLGAMLIADARDDEALPYIEEARNLTYGDPRVEKVYINSLLNTGRLSEAQDLLREMIALYPEDSYFYKQFSDAHKFTEQDPDLHLVKSLAKASGELALEGEPDDNIHAYMALFKVESDLKNTEQAFEYLRKAKSIRKDMLPPYDADEIAERRNQMQQVFNSDLFDALGSAGSKSRSPIFIVGMPRSGTSILERVLSSHPDVAAGGELPMSGRLLEEACVRFGSNQYDITAIGKLPSGAWRELGEKYVQLARERTGDNLFFTDKRSDNVERVGFIKAMLPEATIIHLSRHPVANCLSLYEQDFARISYGNDQSWLGAQYLAYRQTIDHWRTLFKGSIIEIEYESLVTDTAAALLPLGRKLGLEFDASAIEASQQPGEILTASHGQLRQPIHTDSVDRWKLLEKELEPLISVLAPVLP